MDEKSETVTSKYRMRIQLKRGGGWIVHDIRSAQAYECEDLPENIRDRVSLLMMVTDKDTIVPGVGYRFDNGVFYLDPDTL